MGNQHSLSIQEYECNRSKIHCGKEIVDNTKNAQLVHKRLLHAYNMRDRKTLESFIGKDATFSFKGAGSCMALELFIQQVEMMQDSFPDIFVTFDNIVEMEPGVVRVKDFYSRGTHTGAPYSYGPFPAIEATGKEVTEGPCQFTIIVNNEKITHYEIDMGSNNDITGPPGYYYKIGGKMELAA